MNLQGFTGAPGEWSGGRRGRNREEPQGEREPASPRGLSSPHGPLRFHEAVPCTSSPASPGARGWDAGTPFPALALWSAVLQGHGGHPKAGPVVREDRATSSSQGLAAQDPRKMQSVRDLSVAPRSQEPVGKTDGLRVLRNRTRLL